MRTRLRIKNMALMFLIGLTIVLAIRFWAISKLCYSEQKYVGLIVYIPKPTLDLKDPDGRFEKAIEQWNNNPIYRIEFHQFHMVLILLIAFLTVTTGYSFWLIQTRKRTTSHDVVESGNEQSI